MARDVEARLRITAQDRTAKAFSAIEARMRKVDKTASAVNRKQALMARAERAMPAAGGLAMGIGSGRMLAGLGGVVAGAAIAGAIKDYAALERQMTRIGLAAGASDKETKAATASVAGLADQFALPLDQAVSGLDSLVATGMDLKQALAFLPSILKTAQASGAATDEMAASANSLATSFKVDAAQMQQAFDMLVTGGQLGQFELKDMAQYLPSLTASAAKLGFTGLDGTKKLVAMLQTVRQVSGTSAEAATAVGDAIEKTLSPTVANAFKRRGVDIGRVLETAARKGQNQFEAVVDVLDDMTRGMSETQRNMLISSIYTDKEARRAVTAMIALRQEYRNYEAAISDSAGAVDKNLNRVLADNQASVDRLANSWGNLWKAIGRGADAAGAGGAMDGFTGAVNTLVDLIESDEKRKEFALVQSQTDHRARIAAATQTIFDKELEIAAAPKIAAGGEGEDGLEPWQVALQRNQNLLSSPNTDDRLKADLDRAYEDRALAVAAASWDAIDRGAHAGLPLWMRKPSDTPPSTVPGAVPLPTPDPRRVAPPLPDLVSVFGTTAWPVGDQPLIGNKGEDTAPTAPPSTDWNKALSFADPVQGGALGSAIDGRLADLINTLPAPGAGGSPPIAMQIDGDDFAVDALRNAMQAGGGEMRAAGTDAASAIVEAARELKSAAASIGEQGRAAASAISSAKVQVPSAPAPGRGGHARPNANLGVSMPNAGIAGGGN